MTSFGRGERFPRARNKFLPGPGSYRKAGPLVTPRAESKPLTSPRDIRPPLDENLVAKVDQAMASIRTSLARLHEENEKKQLALTQIEQITGSTTPSKPDGRLTYSSIVEGGVPLLKTKRETEVGPGDYDVGAPLEFVRNTHTFNITNNQLFGEMHRLQLQGKPINDEKKAAMLLYKSPAFTSVLNQYSYESAAAAKLEKEKRNAEAIRLHQARKKNRGGSRDGLDKQYLTEPAPDATAAPAPGPEQDFAQTQEAQEMQLATEPNVEASPNSNPEASEEAKGNAEGEDEPEPDADGDIDAEAKAESKQSSDMDLSVPRDEDERPDVQPGQEQESPAPAQQPAEEEDGLDLEN